MKISRMSFIKTFFMSSLLLLGSCLFHFSNAQASEPEKKVSFRFAIASDGHYGQPETQFDALFIALTEAVNSFHRNYPLDCSVILGDIIHNEKELLVMAKQKLDKLAMAYYVVKGNHDLVSDEYWRKVWDMPVNHDMVIKGNVFLFANNYNDKGEYLSPYLLWLKTKLEEYRHCKSIFLFLHIPQAKWTTHSIDNPAFFVLIDEYPNIKAVFHSHEHDKDIIIMHEKIPFMFDSHFGGSWGTTYRGFRIVELLEDDSLVTYMMTPTEKINEQRYFHKIAE
jgi:predicted phosphodiesterase